MTLLLLAWARTVFAARWHGRRPFAPGSTLVRILVWVTDQGLNGRETRRQGEMVAEVNHSLEVIMRPDIVPGGTFPDYELPDEENAPRKLSEIQGEDPLILTLARGNYCPKEHEQHLDLAANYPKIAVAYTHVATISTDTHHSSQEFRLSTGAPWPFLSDPERIVQKDLDIQEYTDPEHDPMIPYTLVLGPRLVVYSIYNGYWFWGRPTFVDLWRDLRALMSEIRPDWDLSRPGLREAWDAGDYSSFHGWNKRAPEATPSPYAA